MYKKKNYLNLKKFSFAAGAALFGVADISRLKTEFKLSEGILKKLDFAVCVGAPLSGAILEEIYDAPTRLYFHHYRALNAFLDQLALKITHYIQKNSFLAMPIPASQILDWQNQKAHLGHKKVARLAGLGWIGRNNLLVNKALGSQFRLSTILTDMPLKTDKPTQGNCGACRLCVKACPASAIKEDALDFDHIKCFEKLKEFQKQRLVDQYICGVCVNVCKGKNGGKEK